MDVINILGIAPFNGLKLSMEQVANKFHQVNFNCYVGDLKEGVEVVKQLDLEDFDVIISRGGTALLIDSAVYLPVIEIDITVYDIMRALKLSQNLNKKFALVGFKNITNKAYLLNDLLDMNIEIVSIDNVKSAESVLNNLKNNGYEVIISDQITSILARKIGLTAILISSVKESIGKSFEQAISIGNSYSKIKRHKSIYKSLYEKSPVDILVFNDNSQLMEEYSNYSIPDKIKNKILKLNSENNNVISPFKVMHENNVFLIENIYNEDIGLFIYYIRIVDKIVNNDNSVNLFNLDNNISNSLLSNSSLSLEIDKVQKKHLINYAMSEQAVFFVGEEGTGKNKLAQIVASYSNISSMWKINCDSITRKNWEDLFTSINSPFYDDSVIIYMKNLHALSIEQLKQFITFAEKSLLFKRNKIILSYSVSSELSTQSLASYFNKLPIIFYTTVPLSEKKADIPAIATLYINEINEKHAKQVIGFEPRALQRLVEFDWPLNQTQFKRVLEQLIIKSEGVYIKDIDTLDILKKELHYKHPVSQNVIQLDQTLEEINKDIIQLVLSEEEGNKTKTAERLGISRSTLWRLEKKNNL